jgi:hypothetical protein
MFKKGELVEVKESRSRLKSSSNVGVVVCDTGTELPNYIMLQKKENITCCFMDNQLVYVATKNLRKIDEK